MMSEGTKNIVEGMKARGIRKVVGCLSGTAKCCKQGCKKILHLSFVVIFLDTLSMLKSMLKEECERNVMICGSSSFSVVLKS